MILILLLRGTRHQHLSFLLIAVIVAMPSLLHAQPENPDESNIGGEPNIVEEEFDQDDVPGDDELEERLEELEGYRRDPIDLATTTPERLARLPGISLQAARIILEAVDRTAPRDIRDLIEIPGIEADHLPVLQAFTVIGPAPGGSRAKHTVEVRGRLTMQPTPRRGYSDQLYRVTPRLGTNGDSLGLDTAAIGPRYLGPSSGCLVRVIARSEIVEGAVVFEKDPGEQILRDDTLSFTYANYEYVDTRKESGPVERNRLAAFMGGYIGARIGPVKLLAGDYHAEFGQGIALWTTFAARKGGDVAKLPFKNGRGIAGATSAAEATHFRGGAITYDPGGAYSRGLLVSLFGSVRRLDATLAPTTTDTTLHAVAIRADGYRRTHSEFRRSSNLEEQLLGVHVRMRGRKGSLGLTAYSALFSAPLALSTVTGSRVATGALDGSFSMGEVMAFGEMAVSANGTPGGMAGVAGELRGVQLVLAGRYLPATFATLHGTGFGESPAAQHNEQGVYAGLKMRVPRLLTVEAYGDLYGTVDRTASVPFPISGADGMLRLGVTAIPRVQLNLRLRGERKTHRLITEDSLERDRERVGIRTTAGARFDAAYRSPGDRLRLRARLELTHAEYQNLQPAVTGTATMLEARGLLLPELAVSARVVLFESALGDAALYQVEGDLAGRIRTVTLSGTGRYTALSVRWKPWAGVSFGAAYSETAYGDRNVLHPGGLDEIKGRVDNTLAFQVDVRF